MGLTLGYPSLPTPSNMLRWVLTFLVLALVAGVLGFGGIAAGAADIAKVLFFVFLLALVVSLFAGRRTT